MQAVRAAPESAKRMTLGAVVKGRIAKPIRVVCYGVEGVGKSTFAADAPSPIFIGAEDGTSELDVARFPEPATWTDALDAIDTLTNDAHSYRTLAIDTLDWLEPLCWQHVCATRRDKNGRPHESIESFGYGKGYVEALIEWRVLLARLDALRARRGMNIILLAHSWVKTFKNPEDDDFDRYSMKLHEKSSALIKEWADAVLFATYETLTRESNNRTKGVSTGARVLHTQRRAAWDAKNRHDLPETLALSWDAFADAIAAHRPAAPDALRERIRELLEGADEGLRARVSAAVEKAGDDAAQLARIADRLAATVSTKESGR
jgi:hypothetical protein